MIIVLCFDRYRAGGGDLLGGLEQPASPVTRPHMELIVLLLLGNFSQSGGSAKMYSDRLSNKYGQCYSLHNLNLQLY
jgi:hypothetical protein